LFLDWVGGVGPYQIEAATDLGARRLDRGRPGHAEPVRNPRRPTGRLVLPDPESGLGAL